MSAPPVYRLTLAYDGTRFFGFQRQRTRRTVQGVLERALATLTTAPVVIHAAGRTDRGVHAAGQVVSFQAMLKPPVDALPAVLNRLLDPDVAVLEAAQAPDGFHARFSARWKEYVYTFFHAPLRSPLRERYAWRAPFVLDGAMMRNALPQLANCPDYRPFCQVGPQAPHARPLLAVEMEGGEAEWRLRVRARSFLYRMMRRIVGLLVEVGRHRVPVDAVADYLSACRSPSTLLVVPPQGLCLTQVGYGPAEGAPPKAPRPTSWLGCRQGESAGREGPGGRSPGDVGPAASM